MKAQLFGLGMLIVSSTAVQAETGYASWYGFESGRRTANGESFRPNEVSCAHKRLPFETHVKVTDLQTKKSIVCRINDRGPFIRGRIIDLSRGAAIRLGTYGKGTARVSVEVLK